GPIFVRRSKPSPAVAVARLHFNAWAKYPDWKRDDRICERADAALKLKAFRIRHGARDVVLEGGAIDVNGAGTILSTEECLLHPRVQVRNAGFQRADWES